MYTILKMAYAFTSMAPQIATFTLVLSRDGPVSGFSLHVLEHLPSSLGVVGSGSLAMTCSSYMHTGVALHVMVNRLVRAGDSATH